MELALQIAGFLPIGLLLASVLTGRGKTILSLRLELAAAAVSCALLGIYLAGALYGGDWTPVILWSVLTFCAGAIFVFDAVLYVRQSAQPR